MFVQERLPNDITSLRIAEVSSIAVESLRKCQFQSWEHNVGFAIKYSWSRKDVVFRDGESFRLLLSDERLIRLSRFWVGKIGSMLKRRNKSNFALWRIGNVGGAHSAHAALSPRHRVWVKKKRASLSWYSLLRGATRNRNLFPSGWISLLSKSDSTVISSDCSTNDLLRSAQGCVKVSKCKGGELL